MSSSYIIPNVFITNIDAFAKKDFNAFKSLKINIGLRIDHTKSSPDGSLVKKDTSMNNLYTSLYGASPQDKEDIYLSGYVKLNKAINQYNNFYVGFGHTVRVPDPEERYIYFLNMGKY